LESVTHKRRIGHASTHFLCRRKAFWMLPVVLQFELRFLPNLFSRRGLHRTRSWDDGEGGVPVSHVVGLCRIEKPDGLDLEQGRGLLGRDLVNLGCGNVHRSVLSKRDHREETGGRKQCNSSSHHSEGQKFRLHNKASWMREQIIIHLIPKLALLGGLTRPQKTRTALARVFWWNG